jgi:hypothetical protein
LESIGNVPFTMNKAFFCIKAYGSEDAECVELKWKWKWKWVSGSVVVGGDVVI